MKHFRTDIAAFSLEFSQSLLEDRKEVSVSALSQWQRHKSFTQRLIHSVALHHQSARLWI